MHSSPDSPVTLWKERYNLLLRKSNKITIDERYLFSIPGSKFPLFPSVSALRGTSLNFYEKVHDSDET